MDKIKEINNQEVTKEELIKVFEILHRNGIINQNELTRAISVTNKKYKSINSNLIIN